MTDQPTIPRDPFEAALTRHLKVTSEPIPPRLSAAVDQALRDTLPERRTGWTGRSITRPRRATATFAAAASIVLVIAGALALGQLGEPRTTKPATLGALGATSSPAVVESAPENDAIAEVDHWAAGGIDLKNEGFRLRLLDREIRDQAPDSVRGEVMQREAGPLVARLQVTWDATEDREAIALMIDAFADDGQWEVTHIRGYRPYAFDMPIFDFGLVDIDREGLGLDPVVLGETLQSDVRLRVRGSSGASAIEPTVMSRAYDEGRLRIDGLVFQPFATETLARFAPVGRDWSRAEARIDSTQAHPVVGQEVTLKLLECVGDFCQVVPQTRWSVDDTTIASIDRKGTRVGLTPRSVGQVTVTAEADVDHEGGPDRWRVSRSIDIMSAETSRLLGPPASAHEGEFSLFPMSEGALVGDYVVFTAWRCGHADDPGHGLDEEPGTDDDDCETVALKSVQPLAGAGVRTIATVGPSTVLHVQQAEFTAPTEATTNFASVEMVLDGLDEPLLPHLYTQERSTSTGKLPALEPTVWSKVSNDRLLAIGEVLAASGGAAVPSKDARWRPGLDINDDYRIDGVDLALAGAIAEDTAPGAPRAAWSAPPLEEVDGDGDGVITEQDLAEYEAAAEAAARTPVPTPVSLIDGTEVDPGLARAIDTRLSSGETEGPVSTTAPDPTSRTVELVVEQLVELPGNPDPVYLIDDDRNGAVYIDRTDGTVYRANLKNGEVAPVVRSGQEAKGGPSIGTPTQLARADYVVIVDDVGRPFRWSPANSAGAGTLARIKLSGPTAFGAGHGDVEAYDPPVGNYRLYVADPAAAQIMKYTQNFDGSSFSEPVTWLASPSAEVAAADQIYVDFDLYTLLEDETIRRYVAGKWDGSFVPREPPATDEGAAVDYRIIGGSGSDASLGRLYAYDAANTRIVGISKVDGRFMREWVVPDDGPQLDDVRGMYVVEGGLNDRRTARKADQLVWITPDGIYRATLRIPPLAER